QSLPDLEAILVGKSPSGAAAAVGFADRRVYCMRRAQRDERTGLETMFVPARDVAVTVFDSFEQVAGALPDDLHYSHHERVWTFAAALWALDVTVDVERESSKNATCG